MRRKEKIRNHLAPLAPEFLEIEDESSRHNGPPDAQTHFKVTLVSSRFEGMRTIERHRRVNALLADEFAQGLHALAISTFTPAEWDARRQTGVASPPCLGGGKERS